MTTYVIQHTTRYEYDVPVVHAHHLACLRPRELAHQSVRGASLDITPAPRRIATELDYFGNATDSIEVLSPHDNFCITALSTVDTRANPLSERPPLGVIGWEEAGARFDDLDVDLRDAELRFDSPLVRAHGMLRDYALGVFLPGRDLVESVMELNRRIYEDFKYEPAATDVSTPLGQVMRQRRGVCQDFAHVAIGCLRSMGLAARYVSGYLETVPPEGKPRLVGADASHAWASAFVPGCGWLDFDPTNDVLPSDRHITLAWGRDFSDVSPLKGVVLGGGAHRLSIAVDVEPRRSASVAPARDTTPSPAPRAT